MHRRVARVHASTRSVEAGPRPRARGARPVSTAISGVRPARASPTRPTRPPRRAGGSRRWSASNSRSTGLEAAIGDAVSSRHAGRRACSPRSSRCGPTAWSACPSATCAGVRAGDRVRATGRPLTIPVGHGPARPGARRPRPSRSTAAPALDGLEHVSVDGDAAAPAAPRRWSTASSRLGVRVLDTLDPVRPRPAARHLRRLRRRQVEPAVDDRPRHRRRGVGARPGRRAWPRGARVHRERPRPRGPGPLGRRRRHVRRARPRPPPRRVHRHPHRRVVPRPGPATSS